MILDHLVIQRMDTSGRIVLQNNKKPTGYTQFSKEELQEVLKFGAENLFKEKLDEKDDDSKMDIEEDGEVEYELNLDEILKRAEENQE